MKSLHYFLVLILSVSMYAFADVPMPGIKMSEKVKETFSYISQDYHNGNIARRSLSMTMVGRYIF